MRVIAIDGGEEKRKLCIELGAEADVDLSWSADVAAEVLKVTTYCARGVHWRKGGQRGRTGPSETSWYDGRCGQSNRY